jgi:hypothetical protein
MQIEPADMIRHHVARKQADGELVLLAEALGERTIEVARRDAQFVGQRFRLRIQIMLFTTCRTASSSPASTSQGTPPKIMRADMAAYDADPANYTQSLGCWHGFIAQQKLISIKKHFGTTKGRYLYLSGWMVARCAASSAPCPTSRCMRRPPSRADRGALHLPAQADARELGMLFRDLDAAREAGDRSRPS